VYREQFLTCKRSEDSHLANRRDFVLVRPIVNFKIVTVKIPGKKGYAGKVNFS